MQCMCIYYYRITGWEDEIPYWWALALLGLGGVRRCRWFPYMVRVQQEDILQVVSTTTSLCIIVVQGQMASVFPSITLACCHYPGSHAPSSSCRRRIYWPHPSLVGVLGFERVSLLLLLTVGHVTVILVNKNYSDMYSACTLIGQSDHHMFTVWHCQKARCTHSKPVTVANSQTAGVRRAYVQRDYIPLISSSHTSCLKEEWIFNMQLANLVGKVQSTNSVNFSRHVRTWMYALHSVWCIGHDMKYLNACINVCTYVQVWLVGLILRSQCIQSFTIIFILYGEVLKEVRRC